jgi:hypothetical protein
MRMVRERRKSTEKCPQIYTNTKNRHKTYQCFLHTHAQAIVQDYRNMESKEKEEKSSGVMPTEDELGNLDLACNRYICFFGVCVCVCICMCTYDCVCVW